jgi:hypothetical protein
VFTDQAFEDLGSCLAEYPLSHAVMASGAFPAILEDVTLENYRAPQGGTGEKRRHFQHLYDGGAVDNLGLDTLWETVRTLLSESDGTRPNKCFFFIVDAYTTPQRPDLEERRDTRVLLDYIVNTNVIAAFDALLGKRRSDTLSDYDFREDEIAEAPFQEFTLNVWDERGGAWQVPCAAWHLTFQRLILAESRGDSWARSPDRIPSGDDVGWVVDRIRTRYNLSGPAPYTDEQLQNYLFEAARLLVREDRESYEKACTWFRSNGFAVCSVP